MSTTLLVQVVMVGRSTGRFHQDEISDFFFKFAFVIHGLRILICYGGGPSDA